MLLRLNLMVLLFYLLIICLSQQYLNLNNYSSKTLGTTIKSPLECFTFLNISSLFSILLISSIEYLLLKSIELIIISSVVNLTSFILFISSNISYSCLPYNSYSSSFILRRAKSATWFTSSLLKLGIIILHNIFFNKYLSKIFHYYYSIYFLILL